MGEKQLGGYCRKILKYSVLYTRNMRPVWFSCNEIAKYPSDHQFYLGIFFIWISYFYWVILRIVEPMWRLGDWQGSKCKCKCFVVFSLRTKSLTLICIYGDMILLFTSQKKSPLLFCFRVKFACISRASLIV